MSNFWNYSFYAATVNAALIAELRTGKESQNCKKREKKVLN